MTKAKRYCNKEDKEDLDGLRKEIKITLPGFDGRSKMCSLKDGSSVAGSKAPGNIKKEDDMF